MLIAYLPGRVMMCGGDNSPKENSHAGRQKEAADAEESHECKRMSPEEREQFHNESNDQENARKPQPAHQVSVGIGYSGFQNFTSFK